MKGFFDNLNINEENSAEILRIIDKMPKIGKENVILCLKEYNISEEKLQKIINFVEINGTYKEVISQIRKLSIDNETFVEGVNELEFVCDNMHKLGIPYDNYKINLTITRGLDYYTGTIYETFLNDYMSIGSVSSGGRYDSLTKYYTDKAFPGVGMSIGLTRLFYVFKELGIIKSEKKSTSDVMVLSLNQDDEAFKLATQLRKDGIKVDMCYITKGMKQKMQYASRLMIPYVILLGEDEVKNNLVSFKNMNTGEQLSLSYDETLKILKNK